MKGGKSPTVNFPLTFWDISLWLAIMATILLITSGMLSEYGGVKILISKSRLKTVAFAVSILFLATVAVRIIGMIIAA